MAASVESTAGVYFVPAFSGLYAPYWQTDARGYDRLNNILILFLMLNLSMKAFSHNDMGVQAPCECPLFREIFLTLFSHVSKFWNVVTSKNSPVAKVPRVRSF